MLRLETECYSKSTAEGFNETAMLLTTCFPSRTQTRYLPTFPARPLQGWFSRKAFRFRFLHD